MTNYNDTFSILTGGGADSLDGIPVATISDGDFSFGMISGLYHPYHYVAASVEGENSPYVIIPNDNVSGTGAWILGGFQGAFSHVSVSRSAVLSVEDTTWTTFILNAEEYDLLSEFNTTMGLFTVATAATTGYYIANGEVSSENISYATGEQFMVGLSIDGAASPTYIGERQLFRATENSIVTRQISRVIKLTATQTLELMIYQSSGGTENMGGNANRNWLTIDRIA